LVTSNVAAVSLRSYPRRSRREIWRIASASKRLEECASLHLAKSMDQSGQLEWGTEVRAVPIPAPKLCTMLELREGQLMKLVI
jgi:hypothetical protein